MLRFRDLGCLVFDLGCFVFEIWVLRASVFVFECFVFETTHECEGKFPFYICIGMLLISLSCRCKRKYSGKYSLGFSEEFYQGEYNFLSCCGSLSIIVDTMKTIQDTLPQKVNDATRRTNWVTIIVICPRRGMKQRVEHLYTVSVYILETCSVRIIIVEVLLYTRCNFK